MEYHSNQPQSDNIKDQKQFFQNQNEQITEHIQNMNYGTAPVSKDNIIYGSAPPQSYMTTNQRNFPPILTGLKGNFHIFILLSTLVIVISFGFLALAAVGVGFTYGSTNSPLFIISIVVLIISAISFMSCLIIYLVNIFRGETSRYLQNMHVGGQYFKYINGIQNQPVHLGMQCECSHMEQRIRYVERRHQQGNRVWTTREAQTYYEKVVTYRERVFFPYSRCEDHSDGINDEIKNYPVVKVRLGKQWTFGDEETKYFYEQFKANFITMNRNRDAQFEMSEFDHLEDYEETSMFVNENKPYCLSLSWFFLWSFVGLTWPYRLWMEVNSAQTDYTFKKVLFSK